VSYNPLKTIKIAMRKGLMTPLFHVMAADSKGKFSIQLWRWFHRKMALLSSTIWQIAHPKGCHNFFAPLVIESPPRKFFQAPNAILAVAEYAKNQPDLPLMNCIKLKSLTPCVRLSRSETSEISKGTGSGDASWTMAGIRQLGRGKRMLRLSAGSRFRQKIMGTPNILGVAFI